MLDSTRRGFLATILAAGAAPAIVKAGSLMRIDPKIWIPGSLDIAPGDDQSSNTVFEVGFPTAPIGMYHLEWELRDSEGALIRSGVSKTPVFTIKTPKTGTYQVTTLQHYTYLNEPDYLDF